MPPIAPRIVKPTTPLCWKPNILRHPASRSSLPQRRFISAYGYTQAKALVFSRHGEPKDVLSCASPTSFHHHCIPRNSPTQHPVQNITDFLLRMQPPHALPLPPSQKPSNPTYSRRALESRRYQSSPRPLSLYTSLHHHSRHIVPQRRPRQRRLLRSPLYRFGRHICEKGRLGYSQAHWDRKLADAYPMRGRCGDASGEKRAK